MQSHSPQVTALIRGAYQAAGAFALMFLTLWMTQGVAAAATAGGIAALGALGFRSLEGTFDQRSGAQRAADEHRAVSDTDKPHVVREG